MLISEEIKELNASFASYCDVILHRVNLGVNMSWKHYGRTIKIPVEKEKRQLLIEALLASGSSKSSNSIEILGLPGYIFPNTIDYNTGRIVIKTGSMVDNPIGVEFDYKFDNTSLTIENLQIWGDISFEYAISAFKDLIDSILSKEYTVKHIQEETYHAEIIRSIDSFFYGLYKQSRNFFAIFESVLKEVVRNLESYINDHHNQWNVSFWHCKENDIESFHNFIFNEIKTKSPNSNGLKELCVIQNFSYISKENQIEYVNLIKKKIRTGFKGMPVIIPPSSIEDANSIGIRNILFIFVLDDRKDHVDQIKNAIIKG